jgi:hypothetical protein
MKRLVATLALAVAAVHPAFAEEALASEASVRELLALTEAKKLSEGTIAQLDQFMNQAMTQELGGRVPTPEQQAILDELRTRLVALVKGALSWEQLEPRYIDMYRKSFSDAEIAGMVQFYKTPAGQAVINKMPVVVQNTMTMVQELLQGIAPQLRQIQTEALEKLKTTVAPQPAPGG